MPKLRLACLTCLTGIVAGCYVPTPTHQLPQGYSESYRRILQQRSADVGPATIPAAIHEQSGMLPPLPSEPSASSALPSAEGAVQLPPIPLDSGI